jgi:hypothetical protein
MENIGKFTNTSKTSIKIVKIISTKNRLARGSMLSNDRLIYLVPTLPWTPMVNIAKKLSTT